MGFVGILVVFGMVFGGFIASGGHMGTVLSAAPLEMMIIAGAALGAYIVSNPTKTIKAGFKYAIKALTSKGPQKKEYTQLLQMLYQLFQLYRKDGPQALEKHIENPEKSEVFTAYPSFMHNHHAVHYLCDTLKVVFAADLSPYDVDDLLDFDLKAIHAEEHGAAHAVQATADAFPGLGIVAAVLGIVKTMSHLTEGTEVIGHLVAHALIGTMLGIFCAYGIVGPIATKMNSDFEAEGRYLLVIKAALVALQRGSPPLVCIEYARRSIQPEERPSFDEMDKATKEIKKAA